MEDKGKTIKNELKKNNLDDNIHIPKELGELLKFIPEDKKKEAFQIIASFTISSASSFSGPLPPPSILSDYNNIVENGAERIMLMAEKQSNHRIELEKHAVKEELNQSGKGQIFGFILAILGILIAFGLAYLGHDTVAGIFGTTTIVGLVAVFVIGKKSQNKDSE